MTNAKFCRNLVCAGLGALALGYVPLSHAAYATLSAPAGWSPGAGAVATYSSPVSPAQIAVSELARINANAALTVNGTKVTVPAKLPLVKSVAKKVAAAAIFAHPGLRTAVAVATWIGAAGLAYDVADGVWKRMNPDAQPSTGYEYRMITSACTPGASSWYPTPMAAIQSYAALRSCNGDSVALGACTGSGEATSCAFTITYKGGTTSSLGPYRFDEKRQATCPVGWYTTPSGCVQNLPAQKVSQDEFVRILESDPRIDVDDLPNVVWPASWPVELPQIQPMFVPTGNPVPNPKYDPAKAPGPTNQPFTQPGVNIVPAPSTSNPWQVDLQPVNRPVDSPNGKVDPSPNVNPDGTPKTDSGDEKRNPEDSDKQDLCEKHPDILACQKVDTEVEDAEIPKAQKTVSYMPENPFGGGACPVDQYARVGGQQLKVVDWSRDCQFVRDYVTPVAFVLTTLIVGAILLGGLKP
ncbi:hypothetical protein SDC9_62306 [bioreactor metagenome]|uniref:TspB protein n=1 Tax=bioreactor metagenome TaxID=1076179 RepID=A0A644XIA2_9ZZZZ